jgi:hypothetical protein
MRNMEPVSLKKIGEYVKDIYVVSHEFVNSNNLVGIISFYLEDEILNFLIKILDNIFYEKYKKHKYNKIQFLNEIKEDYKYHNSSFIYYAIPYGDVTELILLTNNWIPVKALIIKGKVRLSFIPYKDFESLEMNISQKNEDDIIVEFKDGKIYNYQIKRNIFMDYRVIKNFLTSKYAVVNLSPNRLTYLIPPIIAMNVDLDNNRVLIRRNGENLTYHLIEGKKSKDEIISGENLRLKTKAEIYFDVKSKSIDKKAFLNSLLTKIPD